MYAVNKWMWECCKKMYAAINLKCILWRENLCCEKNVCGAK